MKFRDDGSAQLQVSFEDTKPEVWLLVIASSESSGVHQGAKRSRTWNFLDQEGKRVRVQIQTEVVPRQETR